MPEGSGRRVCSRCGSNNFETQAACWKCGAALDAVPPALTGTSSPAVSPTFPAPSSTALVASILLGLLLPVVAFPVGLIFLMLDDPRKAQIGRWNLAWSVAGTLLHLVATLLLARVVLLPFTGMVQTLTRSAGASAEQNDIRQGGKILDGAFPSPR